MTRTRTRLAGLAAGILVSMALVTGPVFASNTAVDPGAAPAAFGTILPCAEAWIKARTDPSIENLKAVGDCEVDRRLQTITRLKTVVADADHMTTEHKAALTSILDASASGLTALRAEIDADTTKADLRTDIHRIYTDFRIYALVARQVHLVRADDVATAVMDRLDAIGGTIQDAIDAAKGQGKDVTEAQKHLDAMLADVAAARDEVSGDAAAVLALTPAQWNAGTAEPVLRSARTSLGDARKDLRDAASEARAAIRALK